VRVAGDPRGLEAANIAVQTRLWKAETLLLRARFRAALGARRRKSRPTATVRGGAEERHGTPRLRYSRMMIDELRTRFRGALLRPGRGGLHGGSPRLERAIDRRTALIARCAGADDVVEVVRFARERELPVSVRAAATPSPARGVRRRRDDRPVADEGGPRRSRGAHAARGGRLLWSELDRATRRPGWPRRAASSATRHRRLTLGGGLGHLMRKHGSRSTT
jgi:hypothetical protein